MISREATEATAFTHSGFGNTRCDAKGGSGAVVKAVFKVGNGTNEIPSGSTLRFIRGEKGESEYFTAQLGAGDAGGAGGGGSAVLYRKPGFTGEDDWIILAVAGGGGGAYSGMLAYSCTDTDHGKGAQKGYPAGGAGGHCPDCETGGWGFGGGGYSGGGAGSIAEAGGGSYMNEMNNGIYMVPGETGGGTTTNGYVKYRFNPGADLTSSLHQATQVKFAYNTGKCIDDYGSNTGNGTNIQTYNCHSNPNQWWYFNPADRTIRSKLNLDKCLDLSNSNTNNGTNIQLYRCNGSNAQQWVYNGIHKTIHSGVNSDKCFDAANGVANSGSNVNIQLWSCNYSNTNEQKWTVSSASAVSSAASVKKIIPVLAPNFAVHSHTAAESGSNIQLWTKDNTNQYEQWYFDGLAFKLINYHNFCIDLRGSDTANGNNIQLYDCNGTNAQKWIYDGMNQAIRSVINPDKCMQIMKNTDGVYGKRSNVEIHDCNGSQEQLFLIQE